MRNPIDRSVDPKEALAYAPKWARDPNAWREPSSRPLSAGGDRMTSDPFSEPSRSKSDPLWTSESDDFSIVPNPPSASVPWRDMRSRKGDEDSGGAIFRFALVVLAILVAAIAAFTIVVVVPGARTFIAKAENITASAHDDNSTARVGVNRARSFAEGEATAHTRRSRSSVELASKAYGRTIDAAAADRVSQVPTLPKDKSSVWANPLSAVAGLSGGGSTLGQRVSTLSTAVPPAQAIFSATTGVAGAAASDKPQSHVNVTSHETVNSSVKSDGVTRPLARNEIETLLKQGADFVSVGDFSSARIVFGRVAQAGDARGALALAATYDPIALTKIGAKGVRPNAAKARVWYLRAKELGSKEAGQRLDALRDRILVMQAADKK